MATIAEDGATGTIRTRSDTRFFFVMAAVISAIIVAGFAMNLAMGRSTFAVPIAYHVHAFVFFGWVALYLAQAWTIHSGQIALHRSLGRLAYIWVPAMVAMGFVIMIVSLRRGGGPFFFDQNEFLVSNSLGLVLFGALVMTALRRQRHTGWHRRLILVAMSILSGPGLGRLLPMPLLMPNAWRIMMVVTLIFPVIGMIADKRRLGRVHPAYLVGVGALIAVQVLAEVIAYSPAGIAFTQWVLAGSAGAARPMAAFLPPGVEL